MTATIEGRERRRCPAEFQDRVNEICGLNRFGDPNIKIVWGQTETTVAAGLHGYEERLLCPGTPCWNILRWIAPECFGTPKFFYEMSYDQETGLMDTGEYPYKGRYEVLQPLMHRRMNGDKLVVDHFPLCHMIIDLMIPVLLNARSVSAAEVKAAREEMERLENTEHVGQICDRLMDEVPAYLGAASFAGQGTKSTAFQQKMEQVEEAWKKHGKKNWKRGFFQN